MGLDMERLWWQRVVQWSGGGGGCMGEGGPSLQKKGNGAILIAVHWGLLFHV